MTAKKQKKKAGIPVWVRVADESKDKIPVCCVLRNREFTRAEAHRLMCCIGNPIRKARLIWEK